MHAPPRPKTSVPSGSGRGKSSGKAEAGMYCGTLTTKLPDSMAMCRIDAIQLVAVVGRGRHPDLRTALVHPPPGEGHAVLPADEPADPADPRQVRDIEVVTGAHPVEHALVHRGHELAVPVLHAVGAHDQQGVVERPRALVLALVHADGDVDVALGAGVGEALDERSLDVDARRPHPLPQVSAARRPGGRQVGPRAGRVERHEALREHHESGASVGGVVHELDGLVDGGFRIEDDRRRLHGRHPHRRERCHGRTL